jgi:ribonuclease T
MPNKITDIAKRFRGFLPVVVDIETAGLNYQTDAVLEIAAIILELDSQGILKPKEEHFVHIKPFDGANLDQKALEFNGIDPHHPFRFAISEREALDKILRPIRQEIKATKCNRAILVGHNPTFDLNFLQAAVKRTGYKRNPFHLFSTFDTATLAGVAYGHTVLAVACKLAGIKFCDQQAHSALYDATKTAELFCRIVNGFNEKQA